MTHYRPEWWDWVDKNRPFGEPLVLLENTPEDIRIKFDQHQMLTIKNSREKRAFLRKFVIDTIHSNFNEGLEYSKGGIVLTPTAMIDLIENFNEAGDFISINKVNYETPKKLDITYDFRKDTTDPDVDKGSATLRKYHKLLWSKKLPNGNYFHLSDLVENVYLYYKYQTQEYFLTSDSIVHTYSKWKRTENIIKQIPEKEIQEFLDIAYTIGGYIIFPGNKINNLPTINMERGTNQRIDDRFDLTLECIRRFYNSEKSPLSDTIGRYEDYFKLFIDFKGYCEFFLLQDLTLDNYTKIKYFLPFNDFEVGQYPKNIEDYSIYKKNSIEFNKNRNKRIGEYINKIS